jgi:hypothetical protein
MSFRVVDGFELDRRDVAEGLMQPVVVRPADVLHDGQLELGPGAPDAIGDQLGLEAVDETFGHGVVVGVADRSDRREDVVVVEDLGVGR